MQRTTAIKRRKQIWEALNPEQVGKVFPPVAKHGHAQQQGFAAATAASTGLSKRAINTELARADAIGEDDMQRARGRGASNLCRAAGTRPPVLPFAE